jgi:sec-independent protein translocase protein TatA
VFTGHLPEFLTVLTLALVIFGPKRIPEVGSALGKGIRDFRKGVSDFEIDSTSHDVSGSVEPHPVTPVVSDHQAG